MADTMEQPRSNVYDFPVRTAVAPGERREPAASRTLQAEHAPRPAPRPGAPQPRAAGVNALRPGPSSGPVRPERFAYVRSGDCWYHEAAIREVE